MKPTLEIRRDTDPQNPREWTNLGTMVCWHNNYKLGDKQPKVRSDKWMEENIPKGSVVLPLFLMDHSGLTIRTTSGLFRAVDPQKFDWGQVGVIVATPEDIHRTFPTAKRITETLRKTVRRVLEIEVRVYNDFLTGQCWGYDFTDSDGTENSCCGFLGSTLEKTGLKEAIPEEALPLLEEAWEDRK